MCIVLSFYARLKLKLMLLKRKKKEEKKNSLNREQARYPLYPRGRLDLKDEKVLATCLQAKERMKKKTSEAIKLNYREKQTASLRSKLLVRV